MAQNGNSQSIGTDQFSEMDHAYLETTYQENPMPDEERINGIAQFLGKHPGLVRIWYYFRRCRMVDQSTSLRQLLNYVISARIAQRLEVHRQFVPQFFLNSYLPPRPPENGSIEPGELFRQYERTIQIESDSESDSSEEYKLG